MIFKTKRVRSRVWSSVCRDAQDTLNIDSHCTILLLVECDVMWKSQSRGSRDFLQLILMHTVGLNGSSKTTACILLTITLFNFQIYETILYCIRHPILRGGFKLIPFEFFPILYFHARRPCPIVSCITGQGSYTQLC